MSIARTGSRGAWVLLLAAPSVTVFAPSHAWDVQPLAALAVTLGIFASLWAVAGPRRFFVLTYPIALFGAIAMAADFARHVDVLELLLVGATSRREIASALAPYALSIVAGAGLLALQVWLSGPVPAEAAGPRPRRRLAASLAAVAYGAAVWAWSPGALARAWPMNVVTAAVAQLTGRSDLLATTLPYAPIDPRKPGMSWRARRTRAAPRGRETYVLVIGETVRADRLQACGGRPGVGPGSAAALVFCDVMAGSDSTHTSVPLLISRELPGSQVRVSQDATFMHAFAEAGFTTSWLSVQEPAIAWPDAQRTLYVPLHGSDRASLLQPLRRVLEGHSEQRQLVVVHAYNAHFPYCDRLGGAQPIVAVDCAALGAAPSRERLADWLASYDNAVQESMRFLDAVIAAAETRGGEVFVMYVPDHGENLLDDERGLFQHALREPTRWDTRVPMVVRANAAWREAHPEQWAALADNRTAAVMHADVVPTLLGAAGIGYEERRTSVVDLTSRRPGPRTRWVLRRLGETTDGDRL